MLATKYVSIDTIMSKVRRDLWMDVDKADVYEWTADVMEYLDIPVLFQENVAFLEVKNHRAPMPDGVKAVIQIAKSNSLEITAEKCAKEVVCEQWEEPEEPDCEDKCEGNTYPQGSPRSGPRFGPWLNTQFNYDALCGRLRNHREWEPVRLSNHTFYQSVVCELQDPIYQDSQYEYSLKGDSLVFNFREGVVAFAYLTYRMDDNGDLMIPDDAHFIDTVVAAVRYRLAQRLYDRQPNRQNEGRLDRADRDYQWKIRQAGTKGMSPSTIDEMENRAAAKDYILPRQFRYYDFFGGMNQRETRRYPNNSYNRGRWR